MQVEEKQYEAERKINKYMCHYDVNGHRETGAHRNNRMIRIKAYWHTYTVYLFPVTVFYHPITVTKLFHYTCAYVYPKFTKCCRFYSEIENYLMQVWQIVVCTLERMRAPAIMLDKCIYSRCTWPVDQILVTDDCVYHHRCASIVTCISGQKFGQ